jgi:hypothetical protein
MNGERSSSKSVIRLRNSLQAYGTIKKPRTRRLSLLQGDAFGLLPIKNTGHVSIAFEFFAQGNASLMTSSAHDPQRVSSVPGFQTCVQVLLRDVMLFEQMMAFSLAMQSMHKPVASRMTVLILQYSSKSVAQLRERLG